MTEFKIGDRVRRIGSGHPSGHFPIGREGTVTGFRAGDNRFVLDHDNHYSHDPDYLELVWTTTSGPVRTVTRREIVPGTYGRLNVRMAVRRSDREAGDVSIVLTDRDGKVGPEDRTLLNADELRAAAATMIELADALPLNAEGGDK